MWDTALRELEERTQKAKSMGGRERLTKRKAEGILNSRERIAYLLDDGSFLESGLYAVSARPEDRDKTPADAKIAGFGSIDGRDVAVVSNDFTVMGASSARVNNKKIRHMKEVATKRGMPMIFLGESSGARMPDIMGATGIGAGDNPTQYRRMRETPWVSALLGHCYGSSAWYGAMADYVVMRKGAVLAVSSAKLTSMAIGEEVSAEELGGWKLHTEVTGLVDAAVDTDEEALDLVKRFLSYLPSHYNAPPPRLPVPAGSDDAIQNLLKLVPDARNRGYDMRKIIRAIADRDSMFELKERFGRSLTTALARVDGRTMGFLANNPMFKAGASDPDACDKATSFLVLCDSFNIPIVMLVDQPGFWIGPEGERKGAPGKVMNWMNALSLVTMPKISIIIRKTYGQAVLNMGGAGNADEVACWPTAEVSFMDPEYAVPIVYGVRPDEDPAKFEQLLEEMRKDTSAYAMASIYSAHSVIDPRETREYLKKTLDIHEMRLTEGVGEHLMRTWPTSF